MNIEIVEFYPKKTNPKKKTNFLGTMHVYLVDDHIDIRGVSVVMLKDRYFFRLPHLPGFDGEKRVFYPIFNFTSPEKQKDFFASLIKTAGDFMRKIERVKG